MRKIWIRYAASAAFVAVMAAGYLLPRQADSLREQYRLWCDALSLPGVLLLCAGALVWAGNAGALDGIGYSLRLALRALLPGGGSGAGMPDRRHKRITGYGFLWITGGATVGAALVFLALYYG